jgi:two-component system chemotaxis response regulator CheB
MARWLVSEPDIELVAALRTGTEALAELERADPDVVVLDIDMPELDGMAALPMLLAKRPDLVVIMASALTRRNAEISLRALALGATDYIPKPESRAAPDSAADFRRDLIEKIRNLGPRSRRLRGATKALAAAKRRDARGARDFSDSAAFAVRPTAAHAIALRLMPSQPPGALLIGSSTGGPQALNLIVGQIAPVLARAPVLIVQHMPATFTAILAEHLGRSAAGPVSEAQDGEAIRAGHIYVAPGGRHLTVARRNRVPVAVLNDGPAVNFCKPAVDPLFASAAAVWGAEALALVLTGMGYDGLTGAKAIAARGGTVLAQDEETSVVWGMPGQVAQAGLCSALLPLNDIAAKLNRLFAGERA